MIWSAAALLPLSLVTRTNVTPTNPDLAGPIVARRNLGNGFWLGLH